jgi:isoquinoline 1-oxidoreductase/isoquinoline 1-oxidoreductase beta subunit
MLVSRGRMLSRRGFLTVGGSLVVYLAGCRGSGAIGGVTAKAGRRVLGPWIAITRDNDVVVIVDKCEMGQGVRHMFASIVAEELGTTPDAVKLEEAPVDPGKYGNRHIVPTVLGISLGRILPLQMTGKSSSVADMWDDDKLRDCAARTRRTLVAQAVVRLGKPADQIELRAGRATFPGDRSGGVLFAELLGDPLADASHVTLTKKPRPVLGDVSLSRRRLDAVDKVTGRARFGIDLAAEDLRRDGRPVGRLLVALVARPHRVGESITVPNRDEIARMPGVERVVDLDGGRRGIAVVADTFWHADRARRAMQVPEPTGRKDLANSEVILKAYEDTLAAKTDRGAGEDVAGRGTWQTYVTPFGPHAAMEPLSAVCVRDGDTYHLYAASQFPQSAQAQAARVLGAEVRLHGQLAGGAFGRRGASDFIVEAAEICGKLGGQALKLMWTREDDFRHDYLRPCAVSRVRATGQDHLITRWQHLLMSESANLAMDEEYFAALRFGWALRWLGMKSRQPQGPSLDSADFTMEMEGLADSVYAMPLTRDLVHIPRMTPAIHRTVRGGYVRSVGYFHTIFAMESRLDELAWEIGSDPLEIRLRNLRRPGLAAAAADRQRRLRWCVERVAAMAGEDHVRRRGSGFGLACFSGFDSFAALVVRVERDPHEREIPVRDAWAAVDCGFVLNPDVLDQQVEGGIVFGLSAALKQEITTVQGMVRQTNFHQCDALRLHECPRITVVHRQYELGQATPTGVGELMVPLPAPAVANAVFNLYGYRRRRVPLDLRAGR